MKKFYLIHGFESLPNRGFLPWLMTELYQKAECSAVSLEMSNPNLPISSEWIKKIESEINEPNSNTYLVGHSLGAPAILRYLEKLPEDKKIGAVFLVAAFADKLQKEDLNSSLRKIDNFFESPFNFEHIKKVCDKFFIIHGEKDLVVLPSYAKELGEKLGVEPFFVKDAGHFPSSKVFELPELLEIILKEIK